MNDLGFDKSFFKTYYMQFQDVLPVHMRIILRVMTMMKKDLLN